MRAHDLLARDVEGVVVGGSNIEIEPRLLVLPQHRLIYVLTDTMRHWQP